MAIRTVITRGFGNGTFNGTIGLVVTKGYATGSVAAGRIMSSLAAKGGLAGHGGIAGRGGGLAG